MTSRPRLNSNKDHTEQAQHFCRRLLLYNVEGHTEMACLQEGRVQGGEAGLRKRKAGESETMWGLCEL